jgi:uncharacterized protein YndB with AHSA1/START domain
MTRTASLQITTPTAREVVITRVFDAPRDMVFDALTRPDLMRRWYGRPGWSLAVCDVDLKVGGKFRFVSRRPQGKDVGQYGVYREVVRPKRIVHTEAWEDWDAGECLVTIELEEADGKTTFTATTLFPSQEVRDTILKSGLEGGASEIYDRLAGLLGEMGRG